jgi:cobyrinic acid a,c-diamide synthase
VRVAGTLAIPRIVIGAATSSAGKTTIAAGLMAALTARGLVVQPFKVGPDFIDPTHHTRCCGRACRNLDPFMMGEDGVRETFGRACAGADIAVIEGVMGLHDGIDGTAFGSTAHVARLLEAPVLLAVDAKGASRTVHAVVRGVAGYDPAVRVAGVVFNRIGSARHRELIERGRELPVLGWIPRDDALAVPSRHLGLSLADELASHDAFGDVVGAHVDLDGVIAIARTAPPIAARSTTRAAESDTTIGVAFDSAFSFYYQDNLDRLRDAGARLVFFSPAADELPDVDALYLGGGYPELHAAALEAGPARSAIAAAAADGMPIWGECGGLVYLSQTLEADGRSYRMCGVLPADSAMTGGIRGLGYVDGTCDAGPLSGLHGVGVRGHEFHYSDCSPDADARYALALSRGRGLGDGRDGLFEHATIAGYTHSYFSDRFCSAFVEAARAFARR